MAQQCNSITTANSKNKHSSKDDKNWYESCHKMIICFTPQSVSGFLPHICNSKVALRLVGGIIALLKAGLKALVIFNKNGKRGFGFGPLVRLLAMGLTS